MWTASKCIDLRLFVPATGLDEHHNDDTHEDTKEPLKQILLWVKKRGVPYVPKFTVIYEKAMRLAANTRKDLIDY